MNATLVVAATLSALLAVAALLLERIPDIGPTHLHLGAEYYNIALAISDGRGFSDPFGEMTGPTAWMPPLYPLLLAVLIGILGSKHAVATAVLVLMNTTIVITGIVLNHIMLESRRKLPASVGLAFFIAWVGVFHYWYLAATTDIWVMMLLANFMVLGTFRYLKTGRFSLWRWGLLGGVAALASPTLAIGWAGLVSASFLRTPKDRKKWLLAGAIAVAFTAPWIARNAIVFGKFVPMKANAGFELYQGNVVDQDGVYSLQSMQQHPFNRTNMRMEYQQAGEVVYVQRYAERFRKELARAPNNFLRKVGNRVLAATVRYVPLSNSHHTATELWIMRLIYPVPFLVLVVALWFRDGHRRLLMTLAIMYGAHLLPYVSVAFYIRYLLPLTPALCLFVYLGLDHIWTAWSTRRVESTGVVATS